MSIASNERTRSFTRGIAKLGIAIAVIVGMFYAGQWSAPVKAVTIREKVEVNTLPEHLEKLKDDIVTELETCESAGYNPDAGIIIFDTNNKASVGPLQMQKDHVKTYSKRLYGKEITGQDAVILAVNPATARPFAKDVLFKVEDGWKEWYNCGVKHNLGTKIAYIKKLEASSAE